MAEFLDERLPIDVRVGASYGDAFAVEISTTQGGQEYRRLVHAFPVRHFVLGYTLERTDLWNRVIDLYHRAYGMYAGFRVRCLDDYSTHGDTGSPAATDMPMATVTAGSAYQLQKQYGLGAAAASVGYPVRTLYKPVAGSVLVGVQGVAIRAADITVDNATGRVTFAADQTATVTAITKASSAVITTSAAHGLATGQSVHVSGVAGMTQINGQRGLITSTTTTTLTVAIDSSGFSTYTSGGATHTRPQTGEAVTAGCEFDIPARFNGRLDVAAISAGYREASGLDLIELLNP